MNCTKYFKILFVALLSFASVEASTPLDAKNAFSKELFSEVDESLEGYLIKTPLIYLPTLSDMTGKKVYLKDESRQKGNSFKTRGVTYEVFQTIHEVVTQNPKLLKSGLQLVTQTDGNHGIALILAITSAIEKYSKDYPELAKDIKKIEPVIFTYKTVLSVKRAGMDEAMALYRKSALGKGQGHIYDTYKDYGDARVAREKYIAESGGKAQYMEHGGIKTMHGHGVASLEILKQLEQLGVNQDQKVCLLLPIGAGGPIGLAAALKAYNPKATAAMIQTPRYDAFIRSFKSGKMELNDGSLSPYTVQVEDNGTLKSVVYEDGISVDGPESKEALMFARRFLDDALYANPQAALKLSPLILSDLDQYYKRLDKSEGIVGGTTAIVAEALLSNANSPCIKEADVIVLFGTEGSIDPAIARYTRQLQAQL